MARYLLRLLIRVVINTLTRIEIRGLENLPTEGGYVIASNHLGILDATLVYYVFDRKDLFIPVAEKWANHAFLRWAGKYLNFVFIDRFNPDLHAMREILRRMQNGQVLVIAPEGTRSRVESMQEAKPGVSYLAVKMGFPIVPVALVGTEDRVVFGNLKRLRRSDIIVTAGKPFTLPPLPLSAQARDAALKEYTDEIMCRIAAMLPEKYRGVYAEHPRLRELLKD
ncbi:MAG: 1-acyl-sn-glycerol-3-phosphate acyltransferase [Chloroflexi bacterium]|nr:1-acyl-sn-glycerol-3-phosphate acyltransferase [Chloroflexota bacterium]